MILLLFLASSMRRVIWMWWRDDSIHEWKIIILDSVPQCVLRWTLAADAGSVSSNHDRFWRWWWWCCCDYDVMERIEGEMKRWLELMFVVTVCLERSGVSSHQEQQRKRREAGVRNLQVSRISGSRNTDRRREHEMSRERTLCCALWDDDEDDDQESGALRSFGEWWCWVRWDVIFFFSARFPPPPVWFLQKNIFSTRFHLLRGDQRR